MSKPEQAAHIHQQLQIGLVATCNALLAFKKHKQSPVIVSRDGRIVAIAPEEMPPALPLK